MGRRGQYDTNGYTSNSKHIIVICEYSMVGLFFDGAAMKSKMKKIKDYLFYHEVGPPDIKIYHGDCLEVMDFWGGTEFVDLVITSPPYNLGNDHHTADRKINPYNDNMPEKDYQDQQVVVLCNLSDILTNGGHVFYNHKVRIKKGVAIHPLSWISRTDLVLKQELIWIQGTPNMDACRFFPFTERIYWLTKYDSTEIKNKRYKDYFQWSPVGITGKHDRQFPIELPKTFIDVVPNAKTVLDPYMGRGTTLIACKELNRDCIGIEKNIDYCELAKKRLQNTLVPMF